jgi:hypothetical protein
MDVGFHLVLFLYVKSSRSIVKDPPDFGGPPENDRDYPDFPLLCNALMFL